MTTAPSMTMQRVLSHLATAPTADTSSAAIAKALRIGSEDLFPALGALEYDGLIASDWQDMPSPRRRLYRLTDAGRAQIGAIQPLSRPETNATGNWFWRKLVAQLFGG